MKINRRTVYRKTVDVRWLVFLVMCIMALFALAFEVPVWAAFMGFALLFTAIIGGGLKGRTTLRPPRGISKKELGEIVDKGMKSAVNALPDPCFVVDYRGTTQYVNTAARATFPAVRVGVPLSFGIRAPSLLEALDRVSSSSPAEIIDWSEKVPAEQWFEAHIAPLWSAANGNLAVPRGKPGLIMVVVRDLTEARLHERMRADFVANASHELRTPLASLTGFIETIQGPARNDEVARDRFLQIMLDQGERMRRLIDDLLSLSRIEMRVHVQPDEVYELAPILHHSIDALSPLADELQVKINAKLPTEPIWIKAEQDQLVQVFNNLVENALKYGAQGGKIDISVSSVPFGEHGGYKICVRDYGPGIAPQHLPRLTERFYRVDVETSRQMKGTGLGLAIVKHIINRHRGRLEVESELGAGASFSVTLPAIVTR
ncbi:ATP-binding protein [Polycladidibacter hongkongensis]|uniref:ATP-binding protein n=1 Tax=Polycladidibacter hongkongensis TaxID=1647556 RepID=UPI00082961AE|nr:ATP-binding protein [Pseudovibrio hongkongensis]